MRRFYLFTRMGQFLIGITLLLITIIVGIFLANRFDRIICTPCIEEFFGDLLSPFSEIQTDAEASIRSIPLGC